MKLNKTRKVLNVLSKAMAVVGLVVIISSVAFSVPIVTAQTYSTTAPQWNTGCVTQPSNCNSIEQNWFQVGNSTQNVNWTGTVNANPGDVISFRIYMHNNTCPANDAAGNTTEQCPATIAHNAFVKVNMPQNGGTITATIGSDASATNVSSTVAVNLPAGQTLTFKSGSTQATHNKVDLTTGWPMPNTPQTDNEEDGITTSGITEGDIHGCYTWSRYIVFQAVVSNVTTTSVTTPTAPATTPTTPTTTTTVGAKTLPKTGPEDGALLMLVSMIPAGVLLRRFRV